MKYDWLLQGLTAPICATWEITYACNLSCKHCLSVSGKKHPQELTTAEAKQLIDQMAQMNIFYINMGGGEPLLRDDLIELIEYAALQGLPVQFSTNGMLINKKVAKRLSEIPELRIQVSLDGATAATNDTIRGKGSYQGAVQAIQLLAARQIDLSVNFVVTRVNLSELEQVYQLVKGQGAKFRVARLRPAGTAKENYRDLFLGPSQQKKLYQWVKSHQDVTTGDSYFILSALGEPIPGLNVCGAARATCCINPAGDVYPCAFLLEPEVCAGNVRQQLLVDLWHKSKLFHTFRNTRVKECENCFAYHDCGGGCPAVSYHLTGNLFVKDPECLNNVGKGESCL
jgi:mycofactocin radical SAM maturase